MWNVVGPFEVGSPADLAVVSEVVQSQNRRCIYLAEEDSEAQIAAIAADSVVAEGEEGMVDGVADSVEVEVASVVDVMTMGVADVVVGTAVADSGMYCVPYRSTVTNYLSVVAGVVVLATKVEVASVSTQTADPEGHRTDLVGMALWAADTGAVVMEAAEEHSVHREVVVGMEAGTGPILNGRAQGWTRIAIQSDQGTEHIFSGVPPGSRHGYPVLFGLQYEWVNYPCNESDLGRMELSHYIV
ncbi:hypothetical protein BDM02DRAFT_1500746 [Thelephora ganbajun]|uniref:Uncharacterized protein n=1 Tax=Thelephora ganbajun TaxID=370292 RepID=A0ACB6ZKF6_THEGA|nr:hypothetical protein BDM02DRAFT_1500746 [Thelephora ganbajun]